MRRRVIGCERKAHMQKREGDPRQRPRDFERFITVITFVGYELNIYVSSNATYFLMKRDTDSQTRAVERLSSLYV
ncbi:uncharacterized protein PHALS_10976 [Plasmopara halstedii]|uniref:Uncharacterized protein n=1 Tax=Plasmopara halstedii TaxID=4781 RepID=A0A0P1AIX5_PLAHL|nr:uncharacterized protein PHALS_10976 [Plasmopara halstedii]CEG40793.1 hypothetical protein PHALS_10976 [Plasmopara halstedii]|eukprot:XP_024577162.1 hypothetical protein PHALS_10976 [Plasmopara halstedii]